MLLRAATRTANHPAPEAEAQAAAAAADSASAADVAAAIAAADSAGHKPPAAAEESPSYRMVVNFEQNSLDLTPMSSAALDSMSALFASHKGNRYEVHGYTCPETGGHDKPVRISAQRVERIVYHLIKLGVPGENIVTVVNAPKTTKKGCAEDRQVDIISTGGHWREAAPEPPASPKLAEPTPAPAATAPATEPPPAATAAAAPPPAPVKQPADSGKQIVAVYMAGQEPPEAKGVHNIMGGELARVMSESDKYIAVDRTEAILAQLDREHVYQRSGAVDDDQIKAIGHQLGVQYLCISNINPVGKRYYLFTRLVDIVSAEIARSVTATSTLKDANEMTRIGREIALELLEADRTREQRAKRKKLFRNVAIGLDALGVAAFAYGYFENNNVIKHVEEVDGPEATRAATRRNVAYVVSGVLVGGGVAIHIVF